MNAAATALMGLDVGHPSHEAKLNALTVAELRTVCTHFGLVSTGVKAALVDRIRTHKLAAGGGGKGQAHAKRGRVGKWVRFAFCFYRTTKDHYKKGQRSIEARSVPMFMWVRLSASLRGTAQHEHVVLLSLPRSLAPSLPRSLSLSRTSKQLRDEWSVKWIGGAMAAPKDSIHGFHLPAPPCISRKRTIEGERDRGRESDLPDKSEVASWRAN